ncbi:CHAT domain-containing protein [Lentzea cavernae]|uniref:CHAT domain-containing protein n=1 Tax=Lentzea cavernae TaxID=2020703 RepID=A0ABQ3MPL2_9PSEU|nr:CHAT domain-containing protein [Lentzea cavernae]GHH42228.1 hypothetical protein GCM10017774_38240 [Lentzea cavernae]
MTQEPLDELAAAREEFDEVVREIQRTPEFRDFSVPSGFDVIAPAGAIDPLVYLSTTETTGVALIVFDGTATPVDLPVTSADLRSKVHQYFHAYQAARAEPGTSRWEQALDDVTRWLWDSTMGPVLDAVGGASRTTIVTGGQFGLLPLHAAWTPDDSTPTGRLHAVDRTAISYAAKAQAHRECMRRAAAITGTRLLGVVNPNPHEHDALPDTEWEAAAALARFPGGTVLRHDDANLEQVVHLLSDAQILHFGCHGVAELATPLRSHLQLSGQDVLALARVLDLKLSARLAVLSACETALIGLDLPDEVISLPTGLVQAGVAGVLATLWSVRQRSSAIHMVEFYRRWTDGTPPAAALAETQRWLRDVTVEGFSGSWESALDDEAEWLPAEFGDLVLGDLVGRHAAADDRPWSAISDWAAFTMTGA